MMPSYAFFLGMRAQERGIDLARDSKLRVGLFGAEPTGAQMKERLAELLGVQSFGEYGMNEFLGPGMACQCRVERGMHAWGDDFLLECVDPSTGEPVPEGSEGELVWTWLSAEATAVIRYRSHDMSRITWDRCLCGRRGLDCLTLRVEVKDGVYVSSAELAQRLKTAVRSYLTVTPIVEMMPAGTLAMGDGTSYRVLDYRRGSGRYGAAD
jgi:phenylacetate-CoA ligase